LRDQRRHGLIQLRQQDMQFGTTFRDGSTQLEFQRFESCAWLAPAVLGTSRQMRHARIGGVFSRSMKEI
jgi:hypothetical protein